MGVRTILFVAIWWIITEGAEDSWLVGLPVILCAVLASVVLLPPSSWSLTGFVRFVPFFLWQSLRGGVDVASRSFHPRLPISPRLYKHSWRLMPVLPRLLMANTVSLLPGTLSAEMDEDFLLVHVLDQTSDFAAELSTIEWYVARLFGLNLNVAESQR